MPSLLAFDTSTERIHLAVVRGDTIRVREAEGGALASRELIPMLLGLLDEVGLTPAVLDAVAFGRGPGAFTGLRTACSVAQGLAWGIGKPVLAIDSLLASAEDARAGASHWRGWVTMDARMDEVYAAAYAFDAGRWQTVAAPRLMTPMQLADAWSVEPPATVAGSALVAFGERLPTGAALLTPLAAPRGAALAALALAQWNDGQTLDPALALPTYLRDKVAQTVAEREALARTKQVLR